MGATVSDWDDILGGFELGMRALGCLLLVAFLLVSLSCKSNQRGGLVVTSPEIADILVALGAEDMVVGATRECRLAGAEVVGSFGNVNFDKLVRLAPTAVLATGLEQELLVSKLQKMKIPSHRFYARNIQQMLENVLAVGQICGKQQEAQELVDAFQDSLRALSQTQQAQLRVYVEIATKPLMSVSGSSFVGALLTAAGGENIFQALPRDYSRIRQEYLLKADPQVIFCFVPGVKKKDIANRLGWAELSAVRTGQVFTVQDINPDVVLRATPSCLQGIKRMKELIRSKEAIN